MAHSELLKKMLFYAFFRFFSFSSIFQGVQLTPFTPMCGRPWACLQAVSRDGMIKHAWLNDS